MNKKRYEAPCLTVVKIQPAALLAGSVRGISGNSGMGFSSDGFGDDELDR